MGQRKGMGRTMSRLLGSTLWTEIAALVSGSPKTAAVAYVSSDAIVAFGAGDTLIADATDEAIGAGLTRARVLKDAIDRGATIYSCPDLHAKVMVLGNTAIIGSCNLSSNSANVLAEAAWVTDDPPAVSAARAFVRGLVAQSEPVDDAFITRILQIAVRPRPRGRGQRRPPARPPVILLFFKQAMEGDLKKFARQSATAQTGGGARDFRVSPADVYRAPLQQMLPHAGPQLDVTQGEVYWVVGTTFSHSTVELWSPTRQRPLELRFSRWWSVDAWDIPLATFTSETAAGRRLFYVLELDADGMTWARVLREADLNREDPVVANHVRARVQRTRAGNSASGLVDLSTGLTLP